MLTDIMYEDKYTNQTQFSGFQCLAGVDFKHWFEMIWKCKYLSA